MEISPSVQRALDRENRQRIAVMHALFVNGMRLCDVPNVVVLNEGGQRFGTGWRITVPRRSEDGEYEPGRAVICVPGGALVEANIHYVRELSDLEGWRPPFTDEQLRQVLTPNEDRSVYVAYGQLDARESMFDSPVGLAKAVELAIKLAGS